MVFHDAHQPTLFGNLDLEELHSESLFAFLDIY
jgi:hypothetical protein